MIRPKHGSTFSQSLEKHRLGKPTMFQVIFLLVSLIIERSSASNIKVFNFESRSDSQLVIPVDLSQTQSPGFTFCFWMKLNNWNDSRIFVSENNIELILYHYNYDVSGTISFNKIAKHFSGIHDIKKYQTWQPFCLTYDAQSYKIRLFRDGMSLVKTGTFVDKNGDGSFNFGQWLKFGASQQYPLAASLTDFNVWSR